MVRIIYFVTVFTVITTVLASSMGVTPNISHYDFLTASNHISSASPSGDASGLGIYGYLMDAAVDAWSLWQQYSGNGLNGYAVRIVIPDTPDYVDKNGVPVFRSSVEVNQIGNPVDQWKRIAYTDVRMPSGIDSASVRRIYNAMDSGLFGLSSDNPSAIASNIAITMAEESAVSQFRVWQATYESFLFVIGLSDSLHNNR